MRGPSLRHSWSLMGDLDSNLVAKQLASVHSREGGLGLGRKGESYEDKSSASVVSVGDCAVLAEGLLQLVTAGLPDIVHKQLRTLDLGDLLDLAGSTSSASILAAWWEHQVVGAHCPDALITDHPPLVPTERVPVPSYLHTICLSFNTTNNLCKIALLVKYSIPTVLSNLSNLSLSLALSHHLHPVTHEVGFP